MSTRFNLAILSCAVLATVASVTDAQTLYRWTDPQGRVHYTDSPPSTASKDVRTVNIDPTADARAADSLREQNEALSKRVAERNKTPDERAREQKEADRKARCASLNAVVTALDRGDPVYRRGDKGEKVELRNDERGFEKIRNAQQLQLECGDLANAAKSAASANSANSGNSARTGGAAGTTGAGSGGSGANATSASSSAAPAGKSTPSGSGAQGSTAAPSK